MYRRCEEEKERKNRGGGSYHAPFLPLCLSAAEPSFPFFFFTTTGNPVCFNICTYIHTIHTLHSNHLITQPIYDSSLRSWVRILVCHSHSFMCFFFFFFSKKHSLCVLLYSFLICPAIVSMYSLGIGNSSAQAKTIWLKNGFKRLSSSA